MSCPKQAIPGRVYCQEHCDKWKEYGKKRTCKHGVMKRELFNEVEQKLGLSAIPAKTIATLEKYTLPLRYFPLVTEQPGEPWVALDTEFSIVDGDVCLSTLAILDVHSNVLLHCNMDHGMSALELSEHYGARCTHPSRSAASNVASNSGKPQTSSP